MRRTVVINVVGLTPGLIGRHTPFLKKWSEGGKTVSIVPTLPAVTTTAQSNYLTGVTPSTHGIVGNGWYFRDECEVKFWRQSNKLVESKKIWEVAKEQNPQFTCANLFWWYNMYSSVDYSVTPRPQYWADGRKFPDIYTYPTQLRDTLQQKLGTFPLFDFWGPKTTITSSEWIAESAMTIEVLHQPTLTLIYLPHLDYNLQRYGNDFPEIGKDLGAIDSVCERLIHFYEAKGVQAIVLSEYGITNVSHPISLNRIFRQQGLLAIREENGLELLDAGASRAFAVADHQIAHIYINEPGETNRVRKILEGTPGVALILGENEKVKHGIHHHRAGELIAVADKNSWFTYYYWLDERKAPDFARIVDIHKKPGYDPVELFVNPDLSLIPLRVGMKLAKKKLGFRMLMDVIPLKPELVKGSHGRLPDTINDAPLLISKRKELLPQDTIEATHVFRILLSHFQ